MQNNSVPEPKVPEPRTARPIELEEVSVVLGAIRSCELVYSNSPTDFYVQLENPQQLETIGKYYESSGTVMDRSSVKVGAICVAQFSEDQKWYRARVTSVLNDGVDVQFVDYGNTEVVPFENVKELTEDFSKLPIQATHCALKVNKKADWTEEEMQAFTDEAAGPLQMHVLERKGDLYLVNLMKIVDGAPSSYINDLFCEKKEEPLAVVAPTIDFAPLDFKWKEQAVELYSEHVISMTWLRDPHRFYCQFDSEEEKFRAMMVDLQVDYENNKVPSITDDLKVKKMENII